MLFFGFGLTAGENIRQLVPTVAGQVVQGAVGLSCANPAGAVGVASAASTSSGHLQPRTILVDLASVSESQRLAAEVMVLERMYPLLTADGNLLLDNYMAPDCALELLEQVNGGTGAAPEPSIVELAQDARSGARVDEDDREEGEIRSGDSDMEVETFSPASPDWAQPHVYEAMKPNEGEYVASSSGAPYYEQRSGGLQRMQNGLPRTGSIDSDGNEAVAEQSPTSTAAPDSTIPEGYSEHPVSGHLQYWNEWYSERYRSQMNGTGGEAAESSVGSFALSCRCRTGGTTSWRSCWSR